MAMGGKVRSKIDQDFHQSCLLLIKVHEYVQFLNHSHSQPTKMKIDHFLSKFCRKG